MDEGKGLARRAFLKRAAAGAGAAGALAAYPGLLGGIAAGREATDDELAVPADWAEPMLVFISDAARGEAVVLAGTSEFRLQDRALVSRLMRASGGHTA
jgi:hypothetical protein